MTISNKKILIGCLIAFVIGLNVYNIPSRSEVSLPAESPTQYESVLPNFNPVSLNTLINQEINTPVNFTDYKTVIFTFWATWCPSCRRENAIFNAAIADGLDDVLIIGISVDKEVGALSKYLAEFPLSFPVLKTSKSIALMFDDITAVPTHYIYNTRSGKIEKTMGLIDASELSRLAKE